MFTEKKFGIKINWNKRSDALEHYCVYMNVLPSKRFYIGMTRRKTESCSKRQEEHAKSALNENDLFHRNLRREGEMTVKILCRCSSAEEAKRMEKFYIKAYSRLIYNKVSKQNSYFNTYREYCNIINNVLLNTIEF